MVVYVFFRKTLDEEGSAHPSDRARVSPASVEQHTLFSSLNLRL